MPLVFLCPNCTTLSQVARKTGAFLERETKRPLPGLRERNEQKTWGAMKTCRHCGELKNTEEFRQHPHTRDRLSSWCASCLTEHSRRWREENQDKVEAYNQRRRAEVPGSS